MRGKIIPIITVLFTFLFYILSLITKGFGFIETNIVTGIIFSLSILILPALISKVVFKKKHFGVGYVIGTLIYPLIYALAYLLNNQFAIDTVLIYKTVSLLILFSSLYLFLIEIYQSNIHESKKLSKAIVGILIAIALLLGIRYFVGLDNDSALSLDFLQHNAVSKHIEEGRLCITPNDCSSLFKKLGYTSYFHTIQTVLTVGFEVELGIAETSFNTAFMIIATLSIFSFFQKHFQDDETSFIASLLSVFIFQVGAYSFNFFMPQTFALLIFINILAERKLTWKKLATGALILLASHFIFGPFFIALLILYQIFFNSDIKKKDLGLGQTITVIAFIGIAITFIANLRGFSIEKVIQKRDVEQLGFFTNYYYPQNLLFLIKQYGPLLLPFTFATICHFFYKKKSTTVLFSITYVSFCLICYFLAPTYANKFLIGSSIFLVFNIVSLLNSIELKRWFKFALLISLLFSMLPFYMLNFSNYNTFYTQNRGKISSLVREDAELIDFLQRNKLNCQIVSDPYTQLMVTSQTSYDTAGGQYQELFTRQALINLIENPNEETYEYLLTSTDIKEPFCILLSSRLFSKSMYVNQNNIPWLNSMYEYQINNNYGVGNISNIIEFLDSKGFTIYYTDSNFRLFIPQNLK